MMYGRKNIIFMFKIFERPFFICSNSAATVYCLSMQLCDGDERNMCHIFSVLTVSSVTVTRFLSLHAHTVILSVYSLESHSL